MIVLAERTGNDASTSESMGAADVGREDSGRFGCAGAQPVNDASTRANMVSFSPTTTPPVSGRPYRGLPLLLASRSPRRRALLTEAGFEHVAEHPGFEDGILTPGQVSPRQWVAALASLKAFAGATLPSAREVGGRVVLGADTACLLDGKLVGTPTTAEEAETMIRSFMGVQHDVLTGVAIVDLRGWSGDPASVPQRRRRVLVDTARVRMGTLSDAEVASYVKSGQWQGKAGGYNLSERLAAGWPLEFEGDQTTIMGLPMQRLTGLLQEMATTT